VCKRTQNGQKVPPKRVKIAKSTIIKQICEFGIKKLAKLGKLIGTNIL